MQVAPGGDGIQKLLAAEQEAQRIVSDARKAKQERMRQAKAEAEREIGAYRAEREGAYQKKVSEGSSGSQATFQRLTQETEANVARITEEVQAKKSEVAQALVKMTTSVKLDASA
mmetsp:Transcript_35548/g.105068  ORF Transcript_35548/g.105068 Transcript_35548/m.105068 type:complete len:115 (-) Transcript_35548:120-464(-)